MYGREWHANSANDLQSWAGRGTGGDSAPGEPPTGIYTAPNGSFDVDLADTQYRPYVVRSPAHASNDLGEPHGVRCLEFTALNPI